jgi:hypothetical protein
MTKDEKKQYRPVNELIQQLSKLAGQKFQLSCGHHITWGRFLANDIIIYNGEKLSIVCLNCGR